MCSLGGSNDQLGKLEVKSIAARGGCREVGENSLQHWFMLGCNPKDQGSFRDGDWMSERDKEQESL